MRITLDYNMHDLMMPCVHGTHQKTLLVLHETVSPDLAGLVDIKGVAMYGLAECWRSRLYADLLERGDFVGAGHLADCGHDGDRVSARDDKTA